MITFNIDNEYYLTEVVFYNNGSVYKAPSNKELSNNYVKDPYASGIFPFKKKDGKKYKCSRDMLKNFDSKYEPSPEYVMKTPSVYISKYIDFIVAVGEYDDPLQPLDLFFNVTSIDQLKAVCIDYNLPFPLNASQESFLEDKLDTFAFKSNDNLTIVLAGIKFENGVPVVLKLYLYPKYYNSWKLWMTGESLFNNGEVKERGCILRSSQKIESKFCTTKNKYIPEMAQTELIYSEQLNEIGVYTVCPEKYTDPLVFWEKLIIDSTGNVVNRKKFKSTSYGAMFSGLANFLDFDILPPKIPVQDVKWIATSWYEHSISDTEWFFPVLNLDILKEVSLATGLPYPLSESSSISILNSRASHYPLNDSSMVPIAVGSVVFREGAPVQLLFYKFSRQWETDLTLTCPSGIKEFLDTLQ